MAEKLYMSFEEYKKKERFLSYSELLLCMVGPFPKPDAVKRAKGVIYDRHEQYREFI